MDDGMGKKKREESTRWGNDLDLTEQFSVGAIPPSQKEWRERQLRYNSKKTFGGDYVSRINNKHSNAYPTQLEISHI